MRDWYLSRRRFLAGVPLVPGALLLPRAAFANPFLIRVIVFVAEFAYDVAANIVADLITDYVLHDDEQPPPNHGRALSKPRRAPSPAHGTSVAHETAVAHGNASIKPASRPRKASIEHHNREMSDLGYSRLEPRVYESGDDLLFYGIEHRAGYDGCMVVSAGDTLSCLSGPTVVGLSNAAKDLFQRELITVKRHIGLALLPQHHVGGREPEFGGFEHDYETEFLSDGFRVLVEYRRASFDPAVRIGRGQVRVLVTREPKISPYPFLDATYKL